jgi:cephalosporin hydroxylase
VSGAATATVGTGAAVGDRVYKLWDMPLGRPVVVSKALRHLDPAAFRRAAGGDLAPGALREHLDAAVAAGAVRSVRAEVPTKGVRRFVDLETLGSELEAWLAGSRHGGARAPSRALEEEGDARSVRRSLLRYVARRPPLARAAERLCFRLEHWVALALSSPFAPLQVPEEITALLDLVRREAPRRILEIGSSRGGTLYLFTKVVPADATLLTVDLRIPDPALLRSFARGRQRVVTIEGDSTAPDTLAAVRAVLPEAVDFLFLDGDHSYEGIKRDFEIYAPLVRPGGLIVFHDIVEDNETRYGVVTGGWSGGVPRFWSELKTRYPHREFVRDWAQDACGIGVVFAPERAAVGGR